MKQTQSDKVKNSTKLSVEQISEIARESLPQRYRLYPWTALHDRGRELLDSDLTMNAYFAAYSAWHKGKLLIALKNLPSQLFEQKFNIIDWGCGQGMGTLSVLDFLSTKGLERNLVQTILIDPSSDVVERAKFYVTNHSSTLSVKTISKYFQDIADSEIALDYDYPCLHIFSNILDVSGINLHDLSHKIAKVSNNENYMLIASPYYQQGNRNIASFLSYFKNQTSFFRDFESNKSNLGYTYNISVSRLPDVIADRIHPTNYFPPVEYNAAYISDIVSSTLGKDIKDYFMPLQSFRVYASFDVGSSVTEDYHPVLAVINNIITRGVPTKALLSIEDAFNKQGHSLRNIMLGSISYEVTDKETIAEMLNSDDRCNHKLNYLLYTPIAVARIHKVILEALLTQKLSLEQDKWDILINENDVPCGILAMETFTDMFNNITKMSTNYDTLVLPKINLVVISKNIDSILNLGKKVYVKPSASQLDKLYDIVIDYSSECVSEEYVESYFTSPYNVKDKNYYTVRSVENSFAEHYVYTSEPIIYKPLIENGIDNIENIEHLRYFLRNIFRKDDFRPGQLPILNRAMQKKSVIGLLPTGGGKSLTYQVAAMLQPGITMIVDPLRALMQDQYNGLMKIGIDCVSYIESGQTSQEKNIQEYKIEQSKSLFAFVSPERLSMYKFRERLSNMEDMNVYFSYGVIDEVHCLSEWGHDFRFSYLHIGRVLYNYVKGKDSTISLFGLTATASFDVLADVERELSAEGAFPLDDDTVVRFENSNRLELQYKIIGIPENVKKSEKNTLSITELNNLKTKKAQHTPTLIQSLYKDINHLSKKQTIDKIKKSFLDREGIYEGDYHSEILKADIAINVEPEWIKPQEKYDHGLIVFCPHRQGRIGVYNSDKTEGISEKIKNDIGNPDVSTYIGGDEVLKQDCFLANKTPVMVATKAFGMGIDKPNVRFTINVNMPSSLESFVQEAGRAGRDRRMALSTIIFDPDLDYDVVNFFYDNNFRGLDNEKKLLYFILAKQRTTIMQNYYDKISVETDGFLDALLAKKEGDELYFKISFDFYRLNKEQKELVAGYFNTYLHDTRLPETWTGALEKAIYRLSCISVINDYTKDYGSKTFYIIAKRKADGEYFNNLATFLSRYYTVAKAEEEAEKAKSYKGNNEIHKCLGYLTSFVYTQIAEKRKKAMDDMSTFCKIGLNLNKDWLDLNEELKDFIYYYFNSKYAQNDYVSAENESFSLVQDTDRGRESSFDILFKYMRVVEPEVYKTGTPKDSIKHLQGAIRLIRRAVTDENGALMLLNIFCTFYLATRSNKPNEDELEIEYAQAYEQLRKDVAPGEFYDKIELYINEISKLNFSKKFIKRIKENAAIYELSIHNNWAKQFSYIN